MRTALFVAITAIATAAGCAREPEDTAMNEPAQVAPPAGAPAAPPAATPPTDAAAGDLPPTTTMDDSAMMATATLQSAEGRNVGGTISFTSRDGVVRASGQITGLPADGEHGFHVHENGDCSAPDFSSAGGHFNPTDVAHGGPEEQPHHVGDMGNISADGEGMAEIDAELEGATLGTGEPTDIVGKAVIVHEKADDLDSQPSGDAGGRWACGVIEQGGGANMQTM